uniref:IP01973p n=1 Tax=Drosophila melanogaster TaxID=7227 RepID=Q4V3J1_DROME|nr:IP01973p [Drosophila melanogaster]
MRYMNSESSEKCSIRAGLTLGLTSPRCRLARAPPSLRLCCCP